MKNTLYKLFEHQYLTQQEACELMRNLAAGAYNDAQVASLMTVFLMRHISTAELNGFREAMLSLGRPVDLGDRHAIDIVGTGGDGKDTFNISTCAAFVVAAAGYPVVKHGNYGASSVSGASNVIEQHGVRFTDQPDALKRSLDRCNIAYLHAPLFNPALKAVASVRKSLGVRSFFNMLGPLVNPTRPAYQLLGVYDLALQRLYSYTFQENGTRFAVVHSLDGYDEISLTAPFKVTTSASEQIYTPELIGLSTCGGEALYGGATIEQAASIFDHVLANTATEAQTNAVVANAAFAIRVIEPQRTIDECVSIARHALESGAAQATFDQFIALNS